MKPITPNKHLPKQQDVSQGYIRQIAQKSRPCESMDGILAPAATSYTCFLPSGLSTYICSIRKLQPCHFIERWKTIPEWIFLLHHLFMGGNNRQTHYKTYLYHDPVSIMTLYAISSIHQQTDAPLENRSCNHRIRLMAGFFAIQAFVQSQADSLLADMNGQHSLATPTAIFKLCFITAF